MSPRATGIARDWIRSALTFYPLRVRRRQFEQQRFTLFNERPVEFAFVFRHVAKLYPRKVLDVGTGRSALPQLLRNCGCLVTAIDNVKGYWPTGMANLHYHVINDDITDCRLDDTFDLVTCISVLEHIQNSPAAVRNMFRLLNPGGHLILTFPYTECAYHRNVYTLPDSTYSRNAPYICQSYSRRAITAWLRENGGAIVEQEYWRFWDGEYWTAGNRLIPPRRVESDERHQLSCMLIRKAK
jgi:SAM-dependent methyltransferase